MFTQVIGGLKYRSFDEMDKTKDLVYPYWVGPEGMRMR